MRKPLVAGNWKMHTNSSQAQALASSVVSKISSVMDVEVVLCPPFVWLERVASLVRGTGILVGAQDTFWEDWGAYTGEISPLQLSEMCSYVIVGHSERRHIIGETDEIVARKARAVSRAGMVPILAVGELEQEYKEGISKEIVSNQLSAVLSDGWNHEIVIAYEPVWAIGTGLAASALYAQDMAAFIREQLGSYGLNQENVRILYGGSVNRGNFREFIGQKDIDGALVGGASLKAEEFAELVMMASPAMVD